MLGEPRIAIWPVADTAAATTPTDRAIESAATVGGSGGASTRSYLFQRKHSHEFHRRFRYEHDGGREQRKAL